MTMKIQSINAADMLAAVARQLVNNGFDGPDLDTLWQQILTRPDVWADRDKARQHIEARVRQSNARAQLERETHARNAQRSKE